MKVRTTEVARQYEHVIMLTTDEIKALQRGKEVGVILNTDSQGHTIILRWGE